MPAMQRRAARSGTFVAALGFKLKPTTHLLAGELAAAQGDAAASAATAAAHPRLPLLQARCAYCLHRARLAPTMSACLYLMMHTPSTSEGGVVVLGRGKESLLHTHVCLQLGS